MAYADTAVFMPILALTWRKCGIKYLFFKHRTGKLPKQCVRIKPAARVWRIISPVADLDTTFTYSCAPWILPATKPVKPQLPRPLRERLCRTPSPHGCNGWRQPRIRKPCSVLSSPRQTESASPHLRTGAHQRWPPCGAVPVQGAAAAEWRRGGGQSHQRNFFPAVGAAHL